MCEHKIKPLNIDYSIPSYNPARLLDHLIDVGELRNDAGLSHKLMVMPSLISKVRSRKLGLSEALILRINDEMDIGPDECRVLAGLIVPAPPSGIDIDAAHRVPAEA